MDITLSFLAKSLDKHGVTLVHITYPPLLIVARLITTLQQALKSVMKISKTVCFSDSMTVLYWLKGENSLKQFCDNRVKEINKTTDRDSSFHCSGEENPADIASRGAFPNEFVNSELWFNGPKFLQGGLAL